MRASARAFATAAPWILLGAEDRGYRSRRHYQCFTLARARAEPLAIPQLTRPKARSFGRAWDHERSENPAS
jgi:hypothetical protein